MKKQELRHTITVLNESVLRPPWKARQTLGGGNIEVFHPGDKGGGVLIQFGREVIVIQPSVLPDGEPRGPVGIRTWVGSFHGREWFERLIMGVRRAVMFFESRYAYALPEKAVEPPQ